MEQSAFRFLIRDNFIGATSATSKRAQPFFSKTTFLKSLGPMEKTELYLGFIVTKKIKLFLKGGVQGRTFEIWRPIKKIKIVFSKTFSKLAQNLHRQGRPFTLMDLRLGF